MPALRLERAVCGAVGSPEHRAERRTAETSLLHRLAALFFEPEADRRASSRSLLRTQCY